MSVKEDLTKLFPNRPSLFQDQLLDKTNSRALFGSIQCDIKVSEYLRQQFANLPLIFIKTNVCRGNIGPIMQEYAEKEGLKSQQQRMLISSSELKNCTIIEPLLLFHLEQGLKGLI